MGSPLYLFSDDERTMGCIDIVTKTRDMSINSYRMLLGWTIGGDSKTGR